MKKNIVYVLILLSFCLFLISFRLENNYVETTDLIIPKSENTHSKINQAGFGETNVYEITKASFSKNSVIINFPQIGNLSDQDKQKMINAMIKDEALKVLNYYNNGKQGLSLEINYEIKRNSTTLLSIKYTGVGYVKGAAHPNNIFYSTNINMDKGTRLRLKDIVTIDESFVEKFKQASKAVNSEITGIMDRYTTSDLIRMLRGADSLDNVGTENQTDAFSYFTNNSLGISISVPYALGDHIEFEIEYDKIFGGRGDGSGGNKLVPDINIQ